MTCVDADPAHEACLSLLAGHTGPLAVPTLVIAEAAHQIAQRTGQSAEIRFMGDLAAGDFTGEPVHANDWERIAERLGMTAIATLDRRHLRGRPPPPRGGVRAAAARPSARAGGQRIREPRGCGPGVP